MAGKIKCSYDDCFKHFNTFEAMKKHKAKDAIHDFYCKKCDKDCNDDIELLYHQITSPKHVACPVCGREFKSESGRDRHVEIEHVPKQNIKCVGCGIKFERASAVMAHIERDECQSIRLTDFLRQKAEKQVVQDARAAAENPTAGATIIFNAPTFPPPENEMNLLDDERAFVRKDWQGRPQYDENNEQNGPYVGPPSEEMSHLSISQFPILGPQARAKQDRVPLITDDIPDTDQPPVSLQQLTSPNAWTTTSNNAIHLFKNTPNTTTNPGPAKSTSSINLLDTFTDDDFTPDHTDAHSLLSSANHTPNRHPPSTTSSLRPQAPSTLPPSGPAPNNDPNHSNTHIRTHTPLRPPSHLSIANFHDPVLNTYICPSTSCGAHFPTPQAFHAHLLGPAHTGNRVSCPGCYKKFNTTTALLSHAESGSRRCRVRDALDFDRVVKQVTAGLLAVDGVTEEGGVRYVAREVSQW